MTRPVVHLIPHTHWDREWYLPRAAFEARLVAMLDELVPMLESHPALRFTLDGQTVIALDYLAVRPGMRDRLAALVGAGRLAVGPWYVLADELIPRPASLAKNLALGLRDGDGLGGASRVLYCPDAFGHPDWLPALAAGHGIRWGVLWRGLAPGPDLRRWTAADGSSIAIHHLPPDGYEVGAHLPGAGPRLADAWGVLRDALLDRAVIPHLALPIGADHHAAHPDLPTLADRLAAADPSCEFRFSRWDDYFTSVDALAPELPRIQGELRWSDGRPWSLQGVHGTRCRMKRRHAAAESALVDVAEPLAGAVPAAGGGRAALLEVTWRRLIRSQFHDTIAGTACDEAIAEQEVRLAAVATTCREVARQSLFELIGHDPQPAPAADRVARALAIWTGAAWSGVTVAPVHFFRKDELVGPPGGRVARAGGGAVPFGLRGADGRALPVQAMRTEPVLARADDPYDYPDLDLVDRVWVAFEPRSLPAGRPALFEVGPPAAPAPPDPVTAGASHLANRRVSLRLAPDGTVDVRDRRTGERYTGLFDLVVEPDAGDLYTPSIRRSAGKSSRTVLGVDRLAAGPLVGSLAVRWRLDSPGGVVIGRTALSLEAGSATILCRVDLDNRASDQRLRLRFPIDVAGPAAVDTGQSRIRRPGTRPGTPGPGAAERPVATAPAHGLVSVADETRGISLRLPGFFEYEWSDGEALMLTLVRSVGELSRNDLAERPGHAAWPTPVPAAQEPGLHRIEFVLGVGPDPVPPRPVLVALPFLVGAPEPG